MKLQDGYLKKVMVIWVSVMKKKKKTEQTVSLQKDFSSSEEAIKTSDNESEGEDDVYPTAGDWWPYSEYVGDLEGFSYTLRQQGFLLPQTARPKTEVEYFQLFLTDNLSNENVSAIIPHADDKIQKAKPLPTFSV